MASVTQVGIGNNTSYESLIQGLVNAERTPITQLQTRAKTMQTQLSAFGKLQSAISAVRDAAAKLTRPDTWGALTATSSDTSALTVTAGTGTAGGNFSVAVTQIAASQTLASPAVSADTKLGAGTLTIQLGKWNADQTGFTPKSGATAVNVSIGADDSLTTIRDKINSAGAGVVASVVNDSSGSRLVMRSSLTGESSAFRVTVADGDGNNSDAAGLSRLAFDPSAGISSMGQTQAAQNAKAVINGLPVNSESNTIESAIDGLSMTLLKPATTTVTMNQDKDSIKKTINEFVTAYNAFVQLTRDQLKYDDSTKTAGPLQGDSTAIGMQSQLRQIMSGSTTLAGNTYNRLAAVGLDIQSNGTITVNDTKLNTALGHVTDMKQLFMGLDTGNKENSGIAQRLRAAADEMLSFDGSLSTRQKGLQSRIKDNGERQDKLEDRVALIEKRLRAQYTALDKTMGKMNQLSSYVSQQMTLLGR
ncbi:flagellar filament capping protein FliD [Pelomonas sp. CA6]|uniref:flagellar filament capping protein FliD n=1 Tax=Pelomonas sp. CA6 TaxID=2907999 RepID=UPI001F4BD335|nr:flagellar filament capping protein FliD [Pelomonas sp. CA6]MCH7345837.1 flagellar filament capping protein FliD [Pelomonas sp. CA6]